MYRSGTTYSYRRASIGSRREARTAGIMPLMTPTAARITMATSSVPGAMIKRISPPSGVLRHRAIQGEPSDGERDCIGEHDSQRSAEESNSESLGENTAPKYVPGARPMLSRRQSRACVASPTQHDVHQPDATNAQSQRADKSPAESSAQW